MPKTRSSGNTIASRGSGGGGAGGEIGGGGMGSAGPGYERTLEEMSERIQDRMEEARTVSVMVESRSRVGLEEVQVTFDPATPGMATVQSASGNSYTVNTEEETCTCPDHRFRGARCRHIEATALAQEEIGQGTYVGSAEDQQVNVNETVREHIAHEVAEETDNAERGFSDDEHFYTDNPEQFTADMERLRNEPIPYEYENVLNGSDITFGIELEFVRGNSDAIARELYNLGIVGTPRMIQYHGYSDPNKWKLERDGSVTDGSRGGELVSPILTDTPETWRQIETICEVARRHGGQVNLRTGGHVHVSAEPLDGKRQRWRRLFKAFSGSEESIFRFSGGELGRFRDTHYTASSASDMARGIRARLPEEGSLSDFRTALNHRESGINWRKYRSINLGPFANGTRNAIEIRAFNGSLTPGVIQANVKVAAGLIHTAERSRIQGENEGLTTAAFRKRGKLINQYSEGGQDNASMMRFVDTYFTRKKDKEHIMSILARNSWR